LKPAKGRERMPSASSGGQVHGEQLMLTPMPQNDPMQSAHWEP